jgi:hypothetical protein
MAAHLEYFRAHAPGFENAYMMLSAPQIGVRHARRLTGVGSVLRSRWSEGTALPDEVAVTPAVSPKFPNISIPYGSLVPEKLDGLLAVGRHISCDRNSHGFMREIPQCWLTGQAAGVAAAIASPGDQPRAWTSRAAAGFAGPRRVPVNQRWLRRRRRAQEPACAWPDEEKACETAATAAVARRWICCCVTACARRQALVATNNVSRRSHHPSCASSAPEVAGRGFPEFSLDSDDVVAFREGRHTAPQLGFARRAEGAGPRETPFYKRVRLPKVGVQAQHLHALPGGQPADVANTAWMDRRPSSTQLGAGRTHQHRRPRAPARHAHCRIRLGLPSTRPAHHVGSTRTSASRSGLGRVRLLAGGQVQGAS